MMWRSTAYDWKRRFALLPMQVGRHWYWLVPFWRRFAGDCYEVAFSPPAERGISGGGGGVPVHSLTVQAAPKKGAA